MKEAKHIKDNYFKKMDNKKEMSFLKQAAVQSLAGGGAGFIEVCIMHPMDIVKTRFQLQVKTTINNPLYYNGN